MARKDRPTDTPESVTSQLARIVEELKRIHHEFIPTVSGAGSERVVVGVSADGATLGVGVGSWDCGVLPHIQARDCLNERRIWIEIGIGDAAVARPETRVNGELSQVCEPADLPGSIRFAAW